MIVDLASPELVIKFMRAIQEFDPAKDVWWIVAILVFCAVAVYFFLRPDPEGDPDELEKELDDDD